MDRRDGNQGGSNWLYEFIYFENFGAALNHYCIDDAVSSQNCQNVVVQDFVIRTSHGKHSVAVAGMNGVVLGDDGNGPRTDGSGVKTGCIARRGYIGNVVGDPTAIVNGGVIDGNGIRLVIEQGYTVSDITIEDCTNNVNSGVAELTYSTYSTYSDHPAYLDTQADISNIRSIGWLQYHWWHRTLNWTSASPNNLGYIRSDSNHLIYPPGGNVAMDTPFRFVSTEQTIATWRAQTKASPPGALASIYDPNSTAAMAA